MNISLQLIKSGINGVQKERESLKYIFITF
jgi:hypothetical protein